MWFKLITKILNIKRAEINVQRRTIEAIIPKTHSKWNNSWTNHEIVNSMTTISETYRQFKGVASNTWNTFNQFHEFVNFSNSVWYSTEFRAEKVMIFVDANVWNGFALSNVKLPTSNWVWMFTWMLCCCFAITNSLLRNYLIQSFPLEFSCRVRVLSRISGTLSTGSCTSEGHQWNDEAQCASKMRENLEFERFKARILMWTEMNKEI